MAVAAWRPVLAGTAELRPREALPGPPPQALLCAASAPHGPAIHGARPRLRPPRELRRIVAIHRPPPPGLQGLRGASRPARRGWRRAAATALPRGRRARR